MRYDLNFDPENLQEVWEVTGATVAVFLLVHYGYLTFRQAEECFGQPEAAWRRLYKEWRKHNDPDKQNQGR